MPTSMCHDVIYCFVTVDGIVCPSAERVVMCTYGAVRLRTLELNQCMKLLSRL